MVGYNIPAIAAPPDPETRDIIFQHYSLHLKTGRGCSYFANPKTLKAGGDEEEIRSIWILNADRQDDSDGEVCRGVFQFLWLSVNCRTKVVTFTDSAVTLQEQERNKIEYVDEDMANKVCALKVNSSASH